MPKKTREEKMAAALRRMKRQLESSPTVSSLETPKPQAGQEPIGTISLRDFNLKEKTASPPTKTLTQRADYNYVFKDLRKIAIISVVAIVAEVGLSLTTRLSFVKLILRNFGIQI